MWQVNSAYQHAGSYSEAFLGQGYQKPPIPGGRIPCGTCLSTEIRSVPRDNTCYSESHIALPGVELTLTKAIELLTPIADLVLLLILTGQV